MKPFKEQLEKDLDSVFFNMNEFAETHMIDEKKCPIQSWIMTALSS